MVAEEIKREQTKDNNPNDSDDEADMPDDDDDVNEDEEFELWKLRELKRIKRDRDERAAVEFERKETERRRHLTDAQRMAEDRASGKLQDKDKAKWKFMQKYYHKGAFYVDEDSVKVNNDVRLRDANGATLNDKFDKSALPKIMQVKNFGRQGQTKYTHLVDQDTTQFESAWTMNDGCVADPPLLLKKKPHLLARSRCFAMQSPNSHTLPNLPTLWKLSCPCFHSKFVYQSKLLLEFEANTNKKWEAFQTAWKLRLVYVPRPLPPPLLVKFPLFYEVLLAPSTMHYVP